jgi:hypothetical protein
MKSGIRYQRTEDRGQKARGLLPREGHAEHGETVMRQIAFRQPSTRGIEVFTETKIRLSEGGGLQFVLRRVAPERNAKP